MGNRWARIAYRGFYDVPLAFVVVYQDLKLLFWRAFDEAIDDYPETYEVYVVPSTLNLPRWGTWQELPQLATRHLGRIPVAKIVFDPTTRKAVDTDSIASLLRNLEYD